MQRGRRMGAVALAARCRADATDAGAVRLAALDGYPVFGGPCERWTRALDWEEWTVFGTPHFVITSDRQQRIDFAVMFARFDD